MGSSRQRKSTRSDKAHPLTQRPGSAPSVHLESIEARPVEPADTRSVRAQFDANQAPMAPNDGAPRDTLRRIRAGLEVAKSAAYVSRIALTAQAAGADPDVALVLRRTVADEIGRQVERIDGLLEGVTP